jgi:hypothetical protein
MIVSTTSTPLNLDNLFAFRVTTRSQKGSIKVPVDIEWEIQRTKNLWNNGYRYEVDTSDIIFWDTRMAK